VIARIATSIIAVLDMHFIRSIVAILVLYLAFVLMVLLLSMAAMSLLGRDALIQTDTGFATRISVAIHLVAATLFGIACGNLGRRLSGNALAAILLAGLLLLSGVVWSTVGTDSLQQLFQVGELKNDLLTFQKALPGWFPVVFGIAGLVGTLAGAGMIKQPLQPKHKNAHQELVSQSEHA
jgi:hypothetical protein